MKSTGSILKLIFQLRLIQRLVSITKHLHHQLIHVDLQNILKMFIVMMKTTMLDVIGMEVTVVAVMLTHNIVQLVNV